MVDLRYVMGTLSVVGLTLIAFAENTDGERNPTIKRAESGPASLDDIVKPAKH